MTTSRKPGGSDPLSKADFEALARFRFGIRRYLRISEEIDALEVMAVPSVPFLVTTRIIAGFIAVIPLYVIGLLSSYLASYAIVVFYYGDSAGTYSHYFHLFLPPLDVIWSFFKVLVFAIVIILTHCYYGYTASGGPAGASAASPATGR